MSTSNPLLEEEGLPRFSDIYAHHVVPALDELHLELEYRSQPQWRTLFLALPKAYKYQEVSAMTYHYCQRQALRVLPLENHLELPDVHMPSSPQASVRTQAQEQTV